MKEKQEYTLQGNDKIVTCLILRLLGHFFHEELVIKVFEENTNLPSTVKKN